MSSTAYVQMILALIFVLALMGGLALALRRFGLGQAGTPATGQKRRLSIIESLPVSAQHRAVLIKRDSTEHLVIIGPNGETVVETNIQGTQQP